MTGPPPGPPGFTEIYDDGGVKKIRFTPPQESFTVPELRMFIAILAGTADAAEQMVAAGDPPLSGGGPLRIHGRKFLEALEDAGIIRREDHVRRVVIDAAVDTAVRVYVQRYGDEGLLNPDLLVGLAVANGQEEIVR